MYKCEVCAAQRKAGQPRLTHVVMRDVPAVRFDREGKTEKFTRKEIEREYQVCQSCHEQLRAGVPLYDLMDFFEARRMAAESVRPVFVNVPVELPPAPDVTKPVSVGVKLV